MKRSSNWGWAAAALALAADVQLFRMQLEVALPVSEVVLVMAGHFAASAAFSISMVAALPRRLRKRPAATAAFVFASVAFIPVLGMVGVAMCVLPVLGRSQRFNASPATASVPRQRSAQAHGQRVVARASSELLGVLQHASDARKRSLALVATLRLEDAQAVPLLRLTLKDPDDEVRLLAFALLNRREMAIEARMRLSQAGQPHGGADVEFVRHKALAHDFWELLNLRSPRESNSVSLSDQALEHAEAALRLRPRDAGVQFLSGRIFLARRQLDAAAQAFERALALGIDARQCAAMQVEVAFRKARRTAAEAST